MLLLVTTTVIAQHKADQGRFPMLTKRAFHESSMDGPSKSLLLIIG